MSVEKRPQPSELHQDDFCNKAEHFEAFDDIPLNPNLENTIGDVINKRLGRRDVVKGMLGVTAISLSLGTVFSSSPISAESGAQESTSQGSFKFDEITGGVDRTHHVADGYDADILLSWGDPIFKDSPAFDPLNQTVAAQLKQFGYNNDYVGFIPLDNSGTKGLLCVNHEYTNEEVIFPKIGRQDKSGFKDMTKDLVDIEMAAHGGTVVEIALKDGKWSPVLDSTYNRRITPLTTKMSVDGPAAGHNRLKTKDDPEGQSIIGTINNCAGGITPWGTYLMAEENFHGYFWTDKLGENGKPEKGLGDDQAVSYDRYGVPGLWYAWGKYYDRFNVDKEPNEPNRFGWVVEVDPTDPQAKPVKHTALGRFRHEGAECILNKDGRVVVYCGDDARFDYVYRFVSKNTYKDGDKEANMKLLSEGTLSVARFDENKKVTWLPLVFGEGPLTEANGFRSQADVMIDARLAADKLGATPMDRPEDVEPNPITGKVYIMLTNNHKREPGDENVANPRAVNLFGHIIEMTAPDKDHAADVFDWDILLKCGDPNESAVGAEWHPETSQDGWFASPDNCAIDAMGRLWVSTDQGRGWGRTGKADGLYAVETEGDLRAKSEMFFRCPVGAELCGPYFTPDSETLFVAVQHPGTDGTKDFPGFNRESTFEDPATRWPDTDPNSTMPPRPSVVAIRRKAGGKIAS